MTRSALSPILLLVCFVTAGCHMGSWNWKDLGTTSTQASLDGSDTLEVITSIGDVSVLPSDDGRVHVDARVRIREDHEAALTAADAIRDVSIYRTQDGRLVVEDAHRGNADEDDWSVSLTVHTPPVTRVIARTDVGDVTVTSVPADVEARTDVGDIQVQGAADHVDLKVDVGDLLLTADSLTQGSLHTDVGDVDIHLDRAFRGSLDLSTEVGDLTLPAGLQGRWVRDVVSESFRRESDHASLLRVSTDVGDICLQHGS